MDTPDTRGYLPQLAVILAAAVLAMAWQFVFPAVYQSSNDDAAVLFKYVPQFLESFRHGIVYPRWMPDDFKGYGSPVFVFYSPLLYAISALLKLAGLNLVFIKSLLDLLRLFAGGAFVYLLVRDGHGKRAALAAALLYTLLPGRIMDLYYTNSPAGRFAQAFMPMSLYFARKYASGPSRPANLAAFSVSYAALVLSHLATAYLFTPFLLAYGAFVAGDRRYISGGLRMTAGVGLGILLSSFFFLPVLLEAGEVQLQYMGRFDYRDYFLFAFSPGVIPADRENLLLLVRNSVVVEFGLMAAVLYISRRSAGLRLDREARYWLGAACFCLFMMSSLSMFIWKVVPGLSTIQFPARLEPVSTLFLSMCTGVAAAKLTHRHRLKPAILTLVAVLAVCVLVYDVRLVAGSISFSGREAIKIASYTELPEYLPRDVDVGSLSGLDTGGPLLLPDDFFASDINRWGPADREVEVDSPQGATLRVKTFYFPGWKALVDGKEVRVYPEKGTGAILLDIPPGRHYVALKFTNTWPRTAGAAISLFTLGALILLVLLRGRSR